MPFFLTHNTYGRPMFLCRLSSVSVPMGNTMCWYTEEDAYFLYCCTMSTPDTLCPCEGISYGSIHPTVLAYTPFVVPWCQQMRIRFIFLNTNFRKFVIIWRHHLTWHLGVSSHLTHTFYEIWLFHLISFFWVQTLIVNIYCYVYSPMIKTYGYFSN